MTLHPQSIDELQDAVRAHEAITIRGHGTKSPANAHESRCTINLGALNGITEYSADECVFTAMAGTPIREIRARLAAHGQYLPFDPPLVAAGATIGGTVAAGLSGSGRYRYGGVRDFVIGARVVDGEGRLIRSGGKVVKNAAGFLLHHGMVGSLGRLGILTEVTFKVFPAPQTRRTVRVQCDSVPSAFDTVRALEGARFDMEAIDFDHTGALWVRLAGRAQAIGLRVERLRSAIGWPSDLLVARDDEQFWSDAREFAWAPSGASVVKVPSAPVGDSAIGRFGDVISRWADLVIGARFACGGHVAWVAVNDPVAFSARLTEAKLRGLVVRGPQAGLLVGAVEYNEFEERVRSVLDPHHRFSAASHSDR